MRGKYSVLLAALSIVFVLAFGACSEAPRETAVASPGNTPAPTPQPTPALAITGLYINDGDANFMTKEDGSLWAWGSNSHGQLGDGTTQQIKEPKAILAGVRSVAFGDGCTFAILEDGALTAWGNNTDGQLGDGTKTDRTSPEQVMDGVKQVFTGFSCTFALKEDGSLWGWGSNNRSMLSVEKDSGRLTSVDPFGGESLVPIRIMDGVQSAAVGNEHVLAVTTDGSLWIWGHQWYAGLAEFYDHRPLPTQIMEDVASVYAGNYCSFAIKTDRSLWAWGNNMQGRLGGGGRGDTDVAPFQVMEGVKELYLDRSNNNTIALKEDGSLWAWGNNQFGQLGEGTMITRPQPMKIIDGVKAVSKGGAHTLAILNDNSLWAWGCNGSGQLGDGSVDHHTRPIKVMERVKAAYAGLSNSYALKEDGSLWTWGGYRVSSRSWYWSDFSGGPYLEFSESGSTEPVQITAATKPLPQEPSPHSSPLEVAVPPPAATPDLPPIAAVYAGYRTSFLIRSDGSLWACGSNTDYQLCDEFLYASPERIKIMESVKSVAASAFHVLALKEDGSLYSWGGGEGLLGNGTWGNSATPVPIMKGVQAISVSNYQSLALKEDGSLWQWGSSYKNGLSPAKVMDGVKAMAAGDGYTLAVKVDGSLWEWGRNAFGVNELFFSAEPVRIMDGVVSVAASPYNSFALKQDGSLWAWGLNYNGEVGDGTMAERKEPVKIMDGVREAGTGYAIREDGSLWAWGGILTPKMRQSSQSPVKVMDKVKMAANGSNFTIVLKDDGSLWAWGDNSEGQFGDGTSEGSWDPVPIG